MSYLNFKSQYDKFPETAVAGFEQQSWKGSSEICGILKAAMEKVRVVVVECYPGIDDEEVLGTLCEQLKPDHVYLSRTIFYDQKTLDALLAPFLTKDSVRGRVCYGTIEDFIDPEKTEAMRAEIEKAEGTILVYGFGASLLTEAGVLVYADMARWEIQMRFRKGKPNDMLENGADTPLKKYKCGFFIEWRIADKIKNALFDRIDYYLDTNRPKDPSMCTGEAIREGLRQLCRRPFRLVPYFDPGVWGGQWMKEVCSLDPSAPNYAWCFDGVPEENSLRLRFGDTMIEIPATNLVQYQPRELLGEHCYARFGAVYPIRFDLLDTMEGQNLSLQVHPTMDYINKKFGMAYTQDESYYILDTKPGEGAVYLGVKKNVNPKEMVEALEDANRGNSLFDAEKYVNLFPAKKHDHFLIPGGTIHCSAKNTMVLEISATPNNFTFKLWDWARLDLNGMPRPIHIDDGKRVIRFDRDTDWVKKNLINQFEVLHEDENYQEKKTGLHSTEFIETRLFTTKKQITIHCDTEFCMMNLVEGKAAVLESPDGRFPAYTVHYAETFILPAQNGECLIRPAEEGEEIKVIKAYVRHG